MTNRITYKGYDQLLRNASAVEKKVIPAATARVLNRTAITVRNESAKDVVKDGGFKIGDVKKKIKIFRAKANKLFVEIVAIGRPIGLIHFDARQRKKGVSAKAWGQRKIYRGTFIAKTKTRSRGEEEFRTTGRQVFTRKNNVNSLPVKKLHGPGIANTIAQDHIVRNIGRIAQQRIAALFPKEIAFRVERATKGRKR